MNHVSVRIDSAAVAVRNSAASKKTIFNLLSDRFAECYGLDKKMVMDHLEARESLGSTGFGGGVSIPHAKIETLDKPVGIFVRLDEPMAFDSHDGEPVDLIFGLLSPADGGADHLKALAEISRFMRNDDILAKLRGANGADAIYVLLSGQQEQQAA